MEKQVKFIKSLSEVVEKYDGFIIDAWGTIHDGTKPFQYVVATLEKLKELNKKSCILSNSPRTIEDLKKFLLKINLDPELFTGMHTSGQEFVNQYTKNPEMFGKKLLHYGPEIHAGICNIVSAEKVTQVEDCDFVVLTNVIGEGWDTEENTRNLFEKAIKLNKPMVCANSDTVVVNAGVRLFCPGEFAPWYEKLGGKVFYYGKPFDDVYKQIEEIMNIDDPKKILVIGDTLDCDVKGANKFGFDSLLLGSGIFKNELNVQENGTYNVDELEKLTKIHEAFPNYISTELKF